MNKKVLLLVLLITVLSIGAFILLKNNNVSKPSSVNIGAVLPLTGKAAQYGVYFKQGSELALSDAIAEGLIKSDQVQLLIEDGKGDATSSLSAFKKLIQSDYIVACLIDLSNVILAIKPIANKDSIVSINSSSFSSEIEDGDDFIFSVLPNAKQYGSFIGNYCFNNLKYTKAGVLYRNDPMGVSFNENFKNSFVSLGGSVVFSESHATGETDYKTIIQKIRNLKIDMIFVASYGPEIASFARQCKEADYKVQIITYQGFLIKSALDAAGDAANGIICIASSFNPSSSELQVLKLREKLKAKYNTEDLNYYLAAHYDGTKIILEAIAHGNKTGSKIRNYLIATKTFNGLTGTITFDENGLAMIPLIPYKVINDKFVPF
jgi:branched-chain amino acid transport system substrate-binding protein